MKTRENLRSGKLVPEEEHPSIVLDVDFPSSPKTANFRSLTDATVRGTPSQQVTLVLCQS